jgi:hypothetical protein
MKDKIKKTNPEGSAHFILDYERHLFLARPRGIINPSLVDKDLKLAREFSEKCDDHWTYFTNTQEVSLVNPLNIFFLKEIKKLKKLKEIVVYAPTLGNRFLIKLISPIFRPDRILKNQGEYQFFLDSVS